MKSFKYWQEVVLLLLLLALACVALVLDPVFLTPRVQAQTAGSIWELAVVALPVTMIVVTGGIDLSVGAVLSLSAVALGLAFESRWPVAACIGACLGTGTLAGLLNGLFVSKVKVHPLIVTLATMATFYGLAEGLSHGRPISGYPPTLAASIASPTGPAVIVLVAAIVCLILMSRTVSGQALYAIGLNELASRFSGLRVDRIKLAIFTAAGSAAGLAALFYVSRRNTAKADIGQGLELDVVTAVVLGGTSIYGGKGGIVGTLLGVLLVHETRQFVSWHWEKDELNLVVIGCLLLLSVLVQGLFSRGKQRSQ